MPTGKGGSLVARFHQTNNMCGLFRFQIPHMDGKRSMPRLHDIERNLNKEEGGNFRGEDVMENYIGDGMCKLSQ